MDILGASLRDSTKRQYNIYIKKWKRFSEIRKTPWTHTKVGKLLEFFNELYYREKASYSAINTARSAMASFITLDDTNYTVGTHPLIGRYLKGVFKLRTPTPRYSRIWDVKVVLNYLRGVSPASKLTLQLLTLKISMLLALTTAQRVQTIQSLHLDKMTFMGDTVEFHVDDLLKQSRPGSIGTTIRLKAFPGDKRLCVVRYLKKYIHLTEPIRGTERYLLITSQKPHRRATKSTISRWIRTVMNNAGINTDLYKSHSTRAATTSQAKVKHLPIKDILAQAGWASEQTFRKFYLKPIDSGSDFTHTILEH